MRSRLPWLVVLLGFGALAGLSACDSVECGPGTIDRAGKCAPADQTTAVATCGPLTVLHGDQCVPMFPATVCDDGTTLPDTDPTTGVTTCIGTGGGGCSAPIACPTPAAGKQTVCGQIYNFADNTPFAATGATGTKCAAGATEGPCALAMVAVNPVGGKPYATGAVYIDDCGRYRIPDMETAGQSFVVVKMDDIVDIAKTTAPLTGVTVPTFVGFPVMSTRTTNFDTWVVNQATTDMWKPNGGPDVNTASGVYAAVFRAHVCDATTGLCPGGDRLETKAGATIMGNTGTKYYFAANDPNHEIISASATVTGINGTVLTSISPMVGFTRLDGGPIDANCVWDHHTAGASGIGVFFQIYRPVNNGSQTCTL